MMYAIKINNRFCRDIKGRIYKYSSRRVAEIKAGLFIKNLLPKDRNFKVVEI